MVGCVVKNRALVCMEFSSNAAIVSFIRAVSLYRTMLNEGGNAPAGNLFTSVGGRTQFRRNSSLPFQFPPFPMSIITSTTVRPTSAHPLPVVPLPLYENTRASFFQKILYESLSGLDGLLPALIRPTVCSFANHRSRT